MCGVSGMIAFLELCCGIVELGSSSLGHGSGIGAGIGDSGGLDGCVYTAG